jgi:hypothetical protein
VKVEEVYPKYDHKVCLPKYDHKVSYLTLKFIEPGHFSFMFQKDLFFGISQSTTCILDSGVCMVLNIVFDSTHDCIRIRTCMNKSVSVGL